MPTEKCALSEKSAEECARLLIKTLLESGCEFKGDDPIKRRVNETRAIDFLTGVIAALTDEEIADIIAEQRGKAARRH